MKRGISILWIFIGIVFLIFFSVACLFWYQYDTRTYRKDAVATTKEVRKWEAAQKVVMNNGTEEVSTTSAKSNTQSADKTITNTATEVVTKDTFNDTTEIAVETSLQENTDESNISPYGFGPYPKVPEGYSLPISWTKLKVYQEKFGDDFCKEMELMDRVLIKLYNQGNTDFTAANFVNGLVLPIYPNVAYVHLETEDWKQTEDPNIEVRSTSDNILAGSNVSEADKEQISKGIIPDGIEIRSFSDGINPYNFLELY